MYWMHFILYIFIPIAYSAHQWPSEYPELDTDILRDELCPWDVSKQCYIFFKDKEINHPVLNGMIDCDSIKFDKNLGIMRAHYGRAFYQFATCKIQDIFRILCKQPPDTKDTSEIQKYKSLSRFSFLPKTPIKAARSGKAFNHLATKLATSRLIFNAIGLDSTGLKMSYFSNIPKTLQSYMDYFYQEMYISGTSWNMNRDKTRYENIKQILDVIVMKDYQQIVLEGKQLYFQAFDCNFIGCKPNNPNILYYGHTNKDLQLNLELESGCLQHNHACTQSTFKKKQSVITTWSPANFGFVQIESAFRIKYANHWIKNEMNPKPIPNDYKTKQYINNGMAIKSTSIIIPFDFKLPVTYYLVGGRKQGWISNPLRYLKSKQRIKFMGKTTKTTKFYIGGKNERNVQISKKYDNQYIISPIFPPLSQIEITWILYNWRFCWINDFGADNTIKLYSEPPDIIEFSELTQVKSTTIWSMEPMSALYDHKFRMATYSEIRLYPNCGDVIGKTTDNQNPCEYIYFYDATRIEYNEIEKWNENEFSPKIDDEYKYLKLAYDNKKEFKLGMIINPLLGKDATININFDLETNDWKNIYLLPFNTEIETKLLFSENNLAMIQLIAPKLITNAPEQSDEILMGSQRCFGIKLKTKLSQSILSKHSNEIYLRPIIFPTDVTIKRWTQIGYEFDDWCSAGFSLLTINAEKEEVGMPGLMYFKLSDSKSSDTSTLKFGSFCVYFKLYGKYNIFYEIGSVNWYSKDNHLITFDQTLEPLINGIQNQINSNKQLTKLQEIDINNCYSKSINSKSNVYFKQKSYLKPTLKFIIFKQYINVEKPGAIAFEIRQFPKPLTIGDTTDWIKIYISRKPIHGKFIIKPICKTEKKLKFQFQQNANDYYELQPIENGKEINSLEPFYFEIKITAPKDLQCFGHFPYKIDWIIKEVIVNSKNDNINNPPSIYLMVIKNDFNELDIHDTGNNQNSNDNNNLVYDDGLADPKCIQKYNQRQQNEQELGPNGPNGQLAPPLNEMGKKLENGWSASGGDDNNAQEFLKPVTVSETIRNPAELADYLKDYDRLKKYVCISDPGHELCDGNITTSEITASGDGNIPTISETISSPKRLEIWAWQNIIVYIACVIIVIGIIRAMGCCEKSLETKIIEAQMRAMQPINQIPNNE